MEFKDQLVDCVRWGPNYVVLTTYVFKEQVGTSKLQIEAHTKYLGF